MDSSIATDPRFKLLARQLGIDWRQAIGACFLVWLACYDRREEALSSDEIDIAADLEGFAAALEAVSLATVQKDGRLLIHGVKRRIEFLSEQASRGSRGGRASGASRSRASRGGNPNWIAGVSGTSNGTKDIEANASGTAQAHSLTLSPALALDLRDPPPSGGADRGQKEPDLSPSGARLADSLREQLLLAKPDHQLSRPEEWRARRPGWVKQCATLARKVGEQRAAAAISWVFGDQNGREWKYRIVVESPASLDEKLDRIERAMTAPRNGIRERKLDVDYTQEG